MKEKNRHEFENQPEQEVEDNCVEETCETEEVETENAETKHECCHEKEDCGCNEDFCTCGCEDDHCECAEDCSCGCNKNKTSLENEYLQMAQRLQADFDNYRKRVAEQLDFQRQEGVRSVIEVFLPCLDTFKEAKKTIEDEKVLSGVNMIEEKITNALSKLHVEKIDAVGQKFDHNLHEAIANFRDESKENDIILEEYQAGYKLNDRVIRYSKVVVNKLD